jgi:hypothetical protein
MSNAQSSGRPLAELFSHRQQHLSLKIAPYSADNQIHTRWLSRSVWARLFFMHILIVFVPIYISGHSISNTSKVQCSPKTWTGWPLKMGLTGCPKMLVTNCQHCITSNTPWQEAEILKPYIINWVLFLQKMYKFGPHSQPLWNYCWNSLAVPK